MKYSVFFLFIWASSVFAVPFSIQGLLNYNGKFNALKLNRVGGIVQLFEASGYHGFLYGYGYVNNAGFNFQNISSTNAGFMVHKRIDNFIWGGGASYGLSSFSSNWFDKQWRRYQMVNINGSIKYKRFYGIMFIQTPIQKYARNIIVGRKNIRQTLNASNEQQFGFYYNYFQFYIAFTQFFKEQYSSNYKSGFILTSPSIANVLNFALNVRVEYDTETAFNIVTQFNVTLSFDQPKDTLQNDGNQRFMWLIPGYWLGELQWH